MNIYDRVKDLMKLWVTVNDNVELTDENSVLLGTIKYDYEEMLDDYPIERLDKVEYRLPLSVLDRLTIVAQQAKIFTETIKEEIQ